MEQEISEVVSQFGTVPWFHNTTSNGGAFRLSFYLFECVALLLCLLSHGHKMLLCHLCNICVSGRKQGEVKDQKV